MENYLPFIREFGSLALVAFIIIKGAPTIIAELRELKAANIALTIAITELTVSVKNHHQEMTVAHSKEMLAMFEKHNP